MLKKIQFTFAAVIMTLMACSTLATPTATEESAQPTQTLNFENWTINFSHSGGIMGLLRTMTVHSSGEFKISDDRKKTEIEGQLTENELGQIQGFLNGFDFTSPQPKPNMACADCFIYGISIQTPANERFFQAVLNDLSINESNLAPLITILRGVMDRELK